MATTDMMGGGTANDPTQPTASLGAPGGQTPSVAKIPPPPVDIAIRTLQSDLASFALTGGTRPKPQTVSLAPSEFALASAGNRAPAATPHTPPLRILVVALIILFLLAGGGYFVYRLFFSGTGSQPTGQQPQDQNSAQIAVTQPPVQPTSTAPAAPTTTPMATVPVPIPAFVHQSLFVKPVDQTLTLNLPTPGATSTDLQTFGQRISRLFNTYNPKGSFFELATQDNANTPLSFGQFIYDINAPVLDQNFLAATFNPDFTFFVYKDTDGYWPGYILSLQPNQAWLYASPEVAKMESSPSLEVLFATFPGGRAGDFFDDKVGAQQVRALGFSNAAAQFTYGWLHNYLIISTSKNGFAQALQRLQN